MSGVGSHPFSEVHGDTGLNAEEDIKLASVPQVVALLGLAVLDAFRSGILDITVHRDGTLTVSGDVPVARWQLLALLRRHGLEDV